MPYERWDKVLRKARATGDAAGISETVLAVSGRVVAEGDLLPRL